MPGATLGLGASTYLPGAVVQPHLDSGERLVIADVPVFSFPVYVVHDSSLDLELRELALASLQDIADVREEIQAEVIEEQTDQVFFDDETKEDIASWRIMF